MRNLLVLCIDVPRMLQHAIVILVMLIQTTFRTAKLLNSFASDVGAFPVMTLHVVLPVQLTQLYTVMSSQAMSCHDATLSHY
jgi:hypothetical protein